MARRLAAFALATLLAGCGDRARLDALAAGPRGPVAEVVAGDRLKLIGGQEVRLAGVEAPAAGTPYADASRGMLERLVHGRTVELLYAGARPQADAAAVAHARVVGGGPWLEGALLDAGSVRVKPSAGDHALTDLMLAHEARARRRELGLWGLAAYRVRLPEEIAPWETGMQLVEGRIRRVGGGRGRVWLDFTEAWRDAASAEIDTAALRDFRAAGLDPYRLEGRLVRLRGDTRRQHITVAAPEAIEVLAER